MNKSWFNTVAAILLSTLYSASVYAQETRILRLDISFEEHFNQLLIAEHENASVGADDYDSEKIQGNDNLSMYSLMGEEAYAIQTFPDLHEDLQVGIGVLTGNPGLHRFFVDPASTYHEEVYMMDTETNEVYALGDEGVEIELEVGVWDDRFRVYFGTNGLASAEISMTRHRSWFANQTIFVEGIEEIKRVELLDMNGRLCYINHDHQNAYSVSGLRPGIYSLRIQTRKNWGFLDKLLVVN